MYTDCACLIYPSVNIRWLAIKSFVYHGTHVFSSRWESRAIDDARHATLNEKSEYRSFAISSSSGKALVEKPLWDITVEILSVIVGVWHLAAIQILYRLFAIDNPRNSPRVQFLMPSFSVSNQSRRFYSNQMRSFMDFFPGKLSLEKLTKDALAKSEITIDVEQSTSRRLIFLFSSFPFCVLLPPSIRRGYQLVCFWIHKRFRPFAKPVPNLRSQSTIGGAFAVSLSDTSRSLSQQLFQFWSQHRLFRDFFQNVQTHIHYPRSLLTRR